MGQAFKIALELVVGVAFGAIVGWASINALAVAPRLSRSILSSAGALSASTTAIRSCAARRVRATAPLRLSARRVSIFWRIAGAIIDMYLLLCCYKREDVFLIDQVN